MSRLTDSEKQWMASFALVDVFFWFFVGFGCIFDPSTSGEGASFLIAAFYAPFWIVPTIISSLDQNFLQSLIVVSCVGFVGHILFGWLVGLALRKYSVRWFISIPASILFTLLVSISIVVIFVK